MNKDKINGSGCRDYTAYEALKNVEREEQLKKLLATIFYITNLAGFSIEGRITFKDKRTGKIWR